MTKQHAGQRCKISIPDRSHGRWFIWCVYNAVLSQNYWAASSFYGSMRCMWQKQTKHVVLSIKYNDYTNNVDHKLEVCWNVNLWDLPMMYLYTRQSTPCHFWEMLLFWMFHFLMNSRTWPTRTSTSLHWTLVGICSQALEHNLNSKVVAG